jgi:hypothetical protein
MCTAPATLRIIFANLDCRDRGQHHRASIRGVAAPFTLARQQRGTHCARRHFAPSTSVVSVAGTRVSHVLREYAPRFGRSDSTVRGNLTSRGSCSVTDANSRDRLACKAFQTVFQRKQTQHGTLLAWLKASLSSTRISSAEERRMLEDVIAWR